MPLVIRLFKKIYLQLVQRAQSRPRTSWRRTTPPTTNNIYRCKPLEENQRFGVRNRPMSIRDFTGYFIWMNSYHSEKCFEPQTRHFSIGSQNTQSFALVLRDHFVLQPPCSPNIAPCNFWLLEDCSKDTVLT